MKIAAVIPALNEEKTIGNLVISLMAADYVDKEIIVVDGGSTDGTVEIAKRAGAVVLAETGEKKCPANARNHGAAYADADIICFIEADCCGVSKDFFSKAAEAFKNADVIAAYAKLRNILDTKLERIVTLEYGIDMHPTFIRKSVFLEIGSYPLIGYGEDWLLQKNLEKYVKGNNKATVQLDCMVVGHAVHTLKEYYKQNKWYGRTIAFFLKKCRGEGKLFSGILRALFKPVYFILFLSLPLSIFSSSFLIPSSLFFVIFFLLLAKNIGKGWPMLKVLTNLIAGLAMMHGFLVYFFGSRRIGGR